MTEIRYRQNVYGMLFVIMGFTFADFALQADALSAKGATDLILVMLAAAILVLALPEIVSLLYQHTSLLDRFETDGDSE